MVMFASREDAGVKLGRCLQEQRVRADLVLGLPRGGVVVAAGVAHALHLPLDVLVVRKIGHPWHREFAVGALAENGVVVLDEGVIGTNPVVRAELEEIIQEEKERLRSYQARFHPKGAPDLTGKAVLLVDDGLATGATTEAAVLSARKAERAHNRGGRARRFDQCGRAPRPGGRRSAGAVRGPGLRCRGPVLRRVLADDG